MSTLYKNLTKNEFKSDKTSPSLLSHQEFERPRLTGIKIAIVFAFLLSALAVGGVLFLHSALNNERKERSNLESQQIQFRERNQSLEVEADQYRAEIERVREQMKTLTSERDALKSESESSKIQIINLQKKIKELEERNKQLEIEVRRASQAQPVPTASQTTKPVSQVQPIHEPLLRKRIHQWLRETESIHQVQFE